MACSLGGCENPLHAPCSWYSQDRQVLGTCSYYCKNTNTATALSVKLECLQGQSHPYAMPACRFNSKPAKMWKMTKTIWNQTGLDQILRFFPQGGVCPGSSYSDTTSSPLFRLLLLRCIRTEAVKNKDVRKRFLTRAVHPEPLIKEIRGKMGENV